MGRKLSCMLALVTLIFCTGMGDLGGYPEGTIPETDSNLKVDLTDRSETSIRLQQFSMDGSLTLRAELGQGTLSIPFESIKAIQFGEIHRDAIEVDVTLSTGEVMKLTVSNGVQFYGSTGFGAYQISSEDILSIVFL